ncbi:MAG: hypothetical protein ACRYG4_13955 [Janthinobacterium lividum]
MTELPIATAPGDPVDIRGHDYIYDRTDTDGAVTFRSPGDSGSIFMVTNKDGFPRRPTCEEVGALMASGELVFRAKPLKTDARRLARQQQLAADQVVALDPTALFRVKMLRRWDASPTRKSDRALAAFVARAMADSELNSMEGAWSPCGGTMRNWIEERGRAGERRTRDGLSMRGRMPRTRKLKHPPEILFYHVNRTANTRGAVQAGHDRYIAEIERINAGVQLNRKMLVRSPDGDWRMSDEPAAYPALASPYVGVSYPTFWRIWREVGGEKAYAASRGKIAAEARYGGGGASLRGAHLGSLCWMDDTPTPNLFLVDDDCQIPMGPATVTVMVEDKTHATVGWDLSAGHASSSTVLRTVRHANLPKTNVPADLLAIDPHLGWIRVRPDRIALDNLSAHHGSHVESALADAYIGTVFAGAKRPRAKPGIERVMGVFQDLLLKRLPDANYDIARMRLYGFDPDTQVLCTIGDARRLLDRAAFTCNLTRHASLDGRQPGLEWKKAIAGRKLNVIEDLDEFEKSMGCVEFDLTLTNAGVELHNRRYADRRVGGRAGHGAVRGLIQDYERAWRVSEAGGKARRRSNDDRKRARFKGRVKYDPDDIGHVHWWNEHGVPKRWVTLECTDPNAHGMPLWLHQSCRDLAVREAMEYCTPAQQAVVRARLFDEIANVTSASSERERRTLAKSLDDPNVRRVFGQFVEVVDEAKAHSDLPPTTPAPQDSVGAELSTADRTDGASDGPRPRKVAPTAPVGIPRRAARPSSTSGRPATEGRKRTGHDRATGTAAVRPEEAGDVAPIVQRQPRRRWGDEL